MKKFIIVLMILSVNMFIVQDLLAYENDLLNALYENIIYGVSTITSGEGYMQCKYTYIDTTSTYYKEFESKSKNENTQLLKWSKAEYYLAFYLTKKRLDVKIHYITASGNEHIIELKQAFNGDKFDYLQIMSNLHENEISSIMGAIKKKPHFNEDFDPRNYGLPRTRKYFGSVVKGESDLATFIEFIKESIQEINDVKEETRDGLIYYVLEGSLVEDNGDVQIVISQEYNFQPTEIEINDGDNLISIKNVYKDYGEGLWFPNKITMNYYKNNDGVKTLKYIEELEIDNDFKVNTEIDPSLFALDFPDGINIRDEREDE